jgi:hypothetical protein
VKVNETLLTKDLGYLILVDGLPDSRSLTAAITGTDTCHGREGWRLRKVVNTHCAMVLAWAAAGFIESKAIQRKL